MMSLSLIPDSEVGAGEDRLSALPESLLHEILSMMELKEAVATSVLSKRWEFLWGSILVLDLGQLWSGADGDILEVINDSLRKYYRSPKIRAFRVEIDYHVLKDTHINYWLDLASQKGVEELDLILMPDFDDGVENTPHYVVPQCLSDCQSLKALRLMFCELGALLTSPSFHYLKKLVLHMVWLKAQLDTSGCPALEIIYLEECNTKEHLDIYAPNPKLELLVIQDAYEAITSEDSAVTIFAPNLQSIRFKGFIRRAYKINDLASIENLCLGFYCFNMDQDLLNRAADSLMALLAKVGYRAPNVALSGWCIQVLECWKTKWYTFPPLKATCLGLQTNLNLHLLSVASTLRRSQFIKSLIMEIHQPSAFCDFEELWGSLEGSLRSIRQLKIVEIYNFLGSNIWCLNEEPEPNIDIDKFLRNWGMEIKLVKVLLNSCLMLEEMHISTKMMPESWRALESELLLALKRRLLALPRASTNAKIYFS